MGRTTLVVVAGSAASSHRYSVVPLAHSRPTAAKSSLPIAAPERDQEIAPPDRTKLPTDRLGGVTFKPPGGNVMGMVRIWDICLDAAMTVSGASKLSWRFSPPGTGQKVIVPALTGLAGRWP